MLRTQKLPPVENPYTQKPAMLTAYMTQSNSML